VTQLYPIGKEHILGKATQADFTSDTFKFLFYAGSYNATHEFISDLTGASIVARSAALTGITISSGVVDCNDTTVTAVSGSAFSAVILCKSTGSDTTSPLIGWYDVATYTPSGGDVTITVNPSGLFEI